MYRHDPHIEPYLSWGGKVEGEELWVDDVSIHVHEKIEPKRIISHCVKLDPHVHPLQQSLFESEGIRLHLDREAGREVGFYKHEKEWANRLILGDSLLVMHSLLYKESMANGVQMVYMDPPYGIKYNSNFQPFTSQREVKDKGDEDLSREVEVIKAFRDTWELGIHSYLSYLRDRLLLVKELLHPSGSVFVQISDENVHLVRIVMEEIFGKENFVAQIPFRTKNMPMGAKYLEQMCDFLVWYAKDRKQLKYRQLYTDKDDQGNSLLKYIGFPDGSYRTLEQEEIENHALLKKEFKKGGRLFRSISLEPVGKNENRTYVVEFEGKQYKPTNSWKYDEQTIDNLIEKKLVFVEGNKLRGKYFLDFYPIQALTIPWLDTNLGNIKSYVVQTAVKVLERCILMTTDPGDLVLDPTCGSGTTAYVAEKWGRRWVTCDTSRVSLTLTKKRLIAATYDYYRLADTEKGVRFGFIYKTVPHVTLKSLANDVACEEEILYDQPYTDSSLYRITGPFTVEGVPSLRVLPFSVSVDLPPGRTLLTGTRYGYYLEELQNRGIRTLKGELIRFTRIESAPSSTHYLHGYGQIQEGDDYKHAYISIGPDYGPLDVRQVQEAMKEVMDLRVVVDYVIFTAFHFDPEVGKYVGGRNWGRLRVLQASMNTDLQTKDLRRGEGLGESFWLVGQPDVRIRECEGGMYRVCVEGLDYYDPATHGRTSLRGKDIVMWYLDTNYDGSCVFPSQLFFVEGGRNDWDGMKRGLKGIIDDVRLMEFTGLESLPFTRGSYGRIAVKVVDSRGIESLVIHDLPD